MSFPDKNTIVEHILNINQVTLNVLDSEIPIITANKSILNTITCY